MPCTLRKCAARRRLFCGISLKTWQTTNNHSRNDPPRSFQHKNIIEFKGACLNFIVMEYAEAGSLYNHLRKLKTNNTAIPPKLLVQWSLDIAEGMRHMGEMSPPVLHRDLKSQVTLLLFLCSFFNLFKKKKKKLQRTSSSAKTTRSKFQTLVLQGTCGL